MAMTWGQLIVGDTVRGADQRAWEVVVRGRPEIWAVAGEHIRFTLERNDDGHQMTTTQKAIEPAPVVELVDRSTLAAAWEAFASAGMTIDIGGSRVADFDQPKQEPEYDQWGRYRLPDPATGEIKSWTRASTIARTLADEYNLTLWKLRMVAKGIAIRPDLIAGAAAADPNEDKSTLNNLAKQAMDAAEAGAGANFGTAFHSFAERVDRGEQLDALRAPSPLDVDLKAYLDCRRKHQLGIMHLERIVVVPELGIAGRFDRIVQQPPGQSKAEPLAIMDLKSAKSVDWSWLEILIQQAIYAHATYMYDLVTKSYEPMPVVDLNRGLILHAPIGKASPLLYAIPLAKGWEWVQLAMRVREARNEAKRKGFAWLVEPEPTDLVVHRVSKAADQTELAQLWEQHHPKGEWTEEVNAAAARRWEEIQADQREIEDRINEATFD